MLWMTVIRLLGGGPLVLEDRIRPHANESNISNTRYYYVREQGFHVQKDSIMYHLYYD